MSNVSSILNLFLRPPRNFFSARAACNIFTISSNVGLFTPVKRRNSSAVNLFIASHLILMSFLIAGGYFAILDEVWKELYCLVYKSLVSLAHTTQDESLMKRVQQLKNYEMKDISGLQAHLDILINSELGYFFERNE